MSTDSQVQTSEAQIFARLWENESGRLSAPAARMVLRLKFRDEDLARVHELARKNSDGIITRSELAEYDSYLKVGDMLAFLQSKARQVLKRKPAIRGRRG
jgi:hypothetical protein